MENKRNGSSPDSSISGAGSGNMVVAQILALIDKRNYEPGDRLPSEREMAERFSVGRGSIREALSILEAIRYVERRPHSGIFLSNDPDRVSLESLVLQTDLGLPLDDRTNSQCLEVRRIIEIQGAHLACSRRTEEDLEALDDIVRRFEIAIEKDEPAGDLDYEFHMQLLRATQNHILVQLVNPFYAMSRRRRQTYFQNSKRTMRSHQQHIKIVEAVRNRDCDLATALVAKHIGRVEEFFLGSNQQSVEQIGTSEGSA